MAIIRSKRTNNFSIVDNDILDDKRLTFKARGLLAYMLSKPDDWRFYTTELAKHSQKDGRDSIDSALKEMEKIGYLKRTQKRSSNGRFGEQDWLLLDTPAFSPQTGFPETVFPETVFPETENPQLLSTDNTNTNSTKDDDDDMAKPISKIIGLWQENFGMPNSVIITDLQDDLKDWGYDLLNYAIHRMLESGTTYNRPYQYLNRILANYRSYGITTVAKAKQSDEKRDAELATKANNYGKPKAVRRSQRLAKANKPKDNRATTSLMYEALTGAYEKTEEEAHQIVNDMLARGELINDGWDG